MTMAELLDFIEAIGPRIIETWKCDKCGTSAWQVHNFEEVLTCACCGHRTASKVAIYKPSELADG